MLVKLTGSMCAHWLEGVDRPFSAIGLKYVLQKLPIATEGILDRAEQQLEAMRQRAVKAHAQQNTEELRDWARKAVLGAAKQARQYFNQPKGIPDRPF